MIRLGAYKNTYFRDCQTFLESKCSWGDDIQALPHLPSYGIFKPDPCRWRLRSFCKTCFKVISSFWTNFDHNSASKSRQYFESFKILTKFQIKKSFQLFFSLKNQHQHIRNNNNLKKFLFGIFKNQSHISQVSQWVNHKGSQWSDLGLIKISFTAILIPDYILLTKTMASSNLTL